MITNKLSLHYKHVVLIIKEIQDIKQIGQSDLGKISSKKMVLHILDTILVHCILHILGTILVHCLI